MGSLLRDLILKDSMYTSNSDSSNSDLISSEFCICKIRAETTLWGDNLIGKFNIFATEIVMNDLNIRNALWKRLYEIG